MAAYYNENETQTAAWLRELIKAKLIADGEVDTRSITDVSPGDVRGFVQCHFFAGIGGWSYALRLAGWDDDRRVWTGSCPCQPFSSAGRGEGEADPRDLWPAWFRLIAECRPVTVFGEQVAGAARGGWLDRLCSDMEAADYAVGACVLGAHSAGAPHIRQRLYFVADASQLTERESTEAPHAVAACGPSRHEPRSSRESMAHANSESPAGASAWPERHSWRAEPDVGRVVNGVSHAVVEPFLRGLGNAIVPQVAVEFIQAYFEARSAA